MVKLSLIKTLKWGKTSLLLLYNYVLLWDNLYQQLVVHPQLCNMLLCNEENTGCQGADSNYTDIIHPRNIGNMCQSHLFPRCLSCFSIICIISGICISAKELQYPFIWLMKKMGGQLISSIKRKDRITFTPSFFLVVQYALA